MGTLGDNGGSWPPEGGGPPEDLPEIPPEWGVVVIPDDPGELADEAAQVRRELRRDARSRTWRRRLHLPPPKPRAPGDEDVPTLGVPLLIVSIAVLATLASLFAVAWPARPRQAVPATTAFPNAAISPTPTNLPDVALSVPGVGRLRATVPAVILLVDGCDCASLTEATIAAAVATDPRIGVVAVGRTAPTVQPPGPRVWAVADPDDTLRKAVPAVPSRPTGRAAVLLADAAGRLVRVLPKAESVDEFRADLMRLTTG